MGEEAPEGPETSGPVGGMRDLQRVLDSVLLRPCLAHAIVVLVVVSLQGNLRWS